MERKRNASEKPREITPDSDQIEAEQREKEEERNNRNGNDAIGQPDEYRPLGSSRGGLKTDSNRLKRLLREFTLNHASQDFGGWMIYFWTQAID
ncbi:hypothetical protein PRIPAC_90688 [Pristionchus pacificus]|uniref:Uncharacterized protein n=1 Tax=Pristionchus pacificus TaxID=54126 RepID=A0A2A6CXZ9_PRIPA|nr:hypothetical protein PRIPAC_90688 [Pristionchus pacificus]|eukprot:PDM82901.1 hypothetical protein PRIPAC_37294 [Pristionchus pacificus]